MPLSVHNPLHQSTHGELLYLTASLVTPQPVQWFRVVGKTHVQVYSDNGCAFEAKLRVTSMLLTVNLS